MARKRTSPVGASELPSSSSRPARVRNAPDRLELSSFDAQHHRSSSSSSKRVQPQPMKKKKKKSRTRPLLDSDEEQNYVRSYTYSHVGSAFQRGKSPDCWVEIIVPARKVVKPAGKTFRTGGTALHSRDNVISLQSPSPDTEGDKETCRARQEKPVDLLERMDAAPTQDRPAITPRPRDGSPIEEDELEASGIEGAEPDALLAHTQEMVHSTDDVNSTPSGSLSYVDALMDEVEVERDIRVDLTKTASPSHHPETRSSHGEDEDHPIPFPSFQQNKPPIRRDGANGVTGRSLFLGSDEEDDDRNRADQQPPGKHGRFEGSAESTLNQARRPEQMASDFITAADKGKQKHVVPVHSTSMSKSSEKSSEGKGQSANGKTGVEADHARIRGEKKRLRRGPTEAPRQRRKTKTELKKQHDKDDLTQNLNVDAYIHSTSNRRSNAKRAKGLKRLQYLKQRAERKRQGEDMSSTASSSSSCNDSSDDNSSDTSDDVVDFIVEDDDDEPGPSNLAQKGAKRIPMPRQNLPPPSLVSRDLMSNIRAMTRPERYHEYIRWVIRYALDLEVTPSMEAARTNLREKFRGDYNSLTTQGNRRQFTWYLKHYPFFERRPMTREEKKEHVGCAACGRKTQKCEDAFVVWGKIYRLETLLKRSDYTSSDMSSEAEDCKTVLPGKKFLFYLGSKCAKVASVKHRLLHWERRVLNDINQMPLFKTLEASLEPIETTPERQGIADDIEAIVVYYYPTLSKRGSRLEQDARTLLNTESRYTRLREKWDDDP